MRSAVLAQVQDQLNNSEITPTQWVVFLIAFLLNVLDGFDVVAMSVALPSLTAEWQISPTQKGYILSAALVGMTLGAMLLAPLADAYGRRRLILFATVNTALSLLLTGLIPESVTLLIVVRFLSGIGIGVIFANTAAIGSEFAPQRLRSAAVTFIIMGYPFGAMLAGPLANAIIPVQGWQMLFIYGGLVTMLMAVFIYWGLPESVEYLASSRLNEQKRLLLINRVLQRMRCAPLHSLPPAEIGESKAGHVRNLFEQGLTATTLRIWAIYFMGFLSVYFLLSWIPTLFVNSGFSRREGIEALTMHNLGAVAGILVIGLLSTKMALVRPVCGYFAGAAMLMGLLYLQQPRDLYLLNGMIFGVGFLLQGAFAAMYAVAARAYPAGVRATGLGWGAGLGRTGAILSPVVAGYLVNTQWTMYQLFLLFAVPLLLAGLLVLKVRPFDT
ncbi:MFS transporter [Alteromonas aestuariivivens]|nr:MFS transporter [Alteromonas aestuariivivens]